MNDSNQQHQLCPCGSGLNYTECCGVPDRRAINADIMACISPDGSIAHGSVTPQIEQALQTISTSPDLFPARIRFADDKAYFVKMSPQWYSESVFLDPARMKGTYVIESNLQWTQTIAENIAWHPTNFIFHTAFCGSTLMAQALDAMFNSLPLREPEVLGNVLFFLRSSPGNDKEKNPWLERVVRLLSRSYDPLQHVVIKANDNANPLMIDLLKWRSDIPVLFMYTPLSEFLVGCLKADNRRAWIRQRFNAIKPLAPSLLNLESELSVDDNAYGEMAATYWSYNIALYFNARQSSQQIRNLDFNQMLIQPRESVEACARLFGLQARADADHDNEINKLFGVYSKNSNFKYSPQQRANDIQRILEKNPDHLEAAERLATELLQNDYPGKELPGKLLE
jgi:hypothetical protein